MKYSVWLIGGMLLVGSSVVQAQIPETTGNVAVFRHADPGVPTMAISVWGAVRATGRYEVERDTDLLQLLTLAGGPALAAQQSGREQHLTIQISRGAPGQRTVVYEARLRELAGSRTTYPALQDGDIVLVEEHSRTRFDWRDVLRVVSSAGTVALVILRVTERL